MTVDGQVTMITAEHDIVGAVEYVGYGQRIDEMSTQWKGISVKLFLQSQIE